VIPGGVRPPQLAPNGSAAALVITVAAPTRTKPLAMIPVATLVRTRALVPGRILVMMPGWTRALVPGRTLVVMPG
jgi:hypothetical protein